jgi:hypothetical protein
MRNNYTTLISVGSRGNPSEELLPLKGLPLYRWRLACKIFRLGCLIGGRHKHTLAYETSWKEYYCPHCGWLPENEADLPGSIEEF